MEDLRTCVSQSFSEMSDEELMERWCGGYLTDVAVEIARTEFSLRGVQPPAYVAREVDMEPVDNEEPSDLVEVARSQALVELEVLAARLRSEGIPPLIVNANTNRMGPQFSNAAGGARLLVPSQFAKDAMEIVALVKAGVFTLGETDEKR
jgi:Putative prokaryotic signal transducing protein